MTTQTVPKPLTLNEIQLELATQSNPSRLAELRVILSHKYGTATDNLEACETLFIEWWGEHRENYKSDAACERAFDKTEAGQQRRHWDLTRKKIDRMSSSIKTLIEVKTAEARNQI